MWVKVRNIAGEDWFVYHSGANSSTTPEDWYFELNSGSQNRNSVNAWNDTAPTNAEFSVGLSAAVNGSGNEYIAYLFSSLSGISKCGSYIGDGTTDGSKVIDCGFTSGARFILIKRTNLTGSWWVWDSVRGIAVGNDPVLGLNLTTAETQYDWLDPDSSGFKVINANTNNSGDNYIFYAIA